MPSSIPIPRDSEAKLQHILRTASQVFAQHGFEGASMRDISRAPSVSVAGPYYYFENKQHLLYLYQSTTFTFVLETLHIRLHGDDEPAELPRLLVLTHDEYFLSR